MYICNFNPHTNHSTNQPFSKHLDTILKSETFNTDWTKPNLDGFSKKSTHHLKIHTIFILAQQNIHHIYQIFSYKYCNTTTTQDFCDRYSQSLYSQFFLPHNFLWNFCFQRYIVLIWAVLFRNQTQTLRIFEKTWMSTKLVFPHFCILLSKAISGFKSIWKLKIH